MQHEAKSPRRGRKREPPRSFAPCLGFVNLPAYPRLTPWAMVFRSTSLFGAYSRLPCQSGTCAASGKRRRISLNTSRAISRPSSPSDAAGSYGSPGYRSFQAYAVNGSARFTMGASAGSIDTHKAPISSRSCTRRKGIPCHTRRAFKALLRRLLTVKQRRTRKAGVQQGARRTEIDRRPLHPGPAVLCRQVSLRHTEFSPRAPL